MVRLNNSISKIRSQVPQLNFSMEVDLYQKTEQNFKKLTNQELNLIDRKHIILKTSPSNEGLQIRLMQWNIFAQGFAEGSAFILCPPEALTRQHRSILQKFELLRFEADIICTQETDLFPDFLTYLNESKTPFYKGTFFAKPLSACIRMPNNCGKDGHAIFYRSDKFHLLEEDHFLFENLGNHGALLAKFQSIQYPEITFGVVCTHLKAKKPYSNVRTFQGNKLLSRLSEKYRDLPLFICGDFNATPDEPVMQAIMSSDLQLDSAYRYLHPNMEEPVFTTWKFRGHDGQVESESCHTIDYILFNKNKAELLSLFELPSKEAIGEKALPNMSYPSDHLSLIADFYIGNT